MFSDSHGHFAELDPLNLLSGLCSGEVLICELEVSGNLTDRWLVHKVCNDEFQHLIPGERIIVRRASSAAVQQPVR